MRVAYSEEELMDYLRLATMVSQESPVVISKFMENAKEVEVDGVSDGEVVLIGAIIEHVENAGIHSGDATMSIPAQTLPRGIRRRIKEYTTKIVKALRIKGPFNIQYLVKNGQPYVIECNIRASRSLPYVSKTQGVNLIELAVAAMLNKKLKDVGITNVPSNTHVGVKVPQFSFMRLSGADSILGVEMLSTGEVACLGENFEDALLKALQSADFKIPPSGSSVLITVGGVELKKKIVPLGRALENMEFRIYATQNTAKTLQNAGVNNIKVLHKIREAHCHPNILHYLQAGKIDLVINIPTPTHKRHMAEVLKDEYTIRRLAIEFNIPVVTTLELASTLVNVLEQREHNRITIQSLNEYMDILEWKLW
jgi:carbamoyl-phosphate synthase large subunit